MSEIISRAEAKVRGLTRYYSGVPCKRGHVVERKVGNRECTMCGGAYMAAYRAANRENLRAADSVWYAANREKRLARKAAYREANREKACAYAAAYCAANPEKVRARKAAYRAANLGKERTRHAAYQEANRGKERTRCAAYNAANRENRRAYAAAYRVANPDKAAADSAAWRAANPESARVQERNRQARKRNAEGRHTAADIQRILKAQKCKCAYCRKSLKRTLHVDHIAALSNGGTNWPNNLQLLCPACNLSKHAKDPIAFAQELGMLL